MSTTIAPLDVTEATNEQLKEAYQYLTANPGKHADVLGAVNIEIDKRVKAQLADLVAWQDEKAASAPKMSAPEPEDEDAPEPSIQDRPQTIDDVVGQTDLVNQIRTVVMGAKLRDAKVPHVLIAGPAGFGKTTLAKVIANDVGVPMIETTGMVLRKVNDIIGLLLSIQEPTVLFIDEVHALPVPVMESLYTAMEDGRVDIVGGSGTDVVASSHKVPGLIVVGATTRPGLLTPPMQQRFGYKGIMAPYSVEELGEIVARAWKRVGADYAEGEQIAVAERCKGVPRLALGLAARVLDVAAVKGSPNMVAAGLAGNALAVFGISESGLDETDYKIITYLAVDRAGKAVGLDAMAQALDIDKVTLADQYEPYLVRQGYIARTSGGRMAVEKAYELVSALQAAA